jgi:hypothetical protein
MHIAELGLPIEVWSLAVFCLIGFGTSLIMPTINKLEREAAVKCGIGVLVILAALAFQLPVENTMKANLDRKFAEVLAKEYKATSSKPYHEIMEDMDEDEHGLAEAIFKCDGTSTEVLIHEYRGELKFVSAKGVYPKSS